jgi:hypothetical protein
MTPGRLNQLQCPGCQQVTWVIDSDCQGPFVTWTPYVERSYACARCGRDGPGWTLGQQSPPEFLLQPQKLCPMTQADFDYWVTVLRNHFPEHTRLQEVGHRFRPYRPEQAEADRQAHARAHPVSEMKDQDGARRVDPDLPVAAEWLEIMKEGDTLLFTRRDGGTLHCELVAAGLSVRCRHANGEMLADVAGVPESTAREAIGMYLRGNAPAAARLVIRHAELRAPRPT